MPVAAVEEHGISAGDESRDYTWRRTREGMWDALTRFYHYSGSDPVAQARSIRDVGTADDLGYPEMYAVEQGEEGEQSENTGELRIDFLGRLKVGDPKLKRVLKTDTWTATIEGASWRKVQGAPVHSGGAAGRWTFEGVGTETSSVAAALEMSHGNVVLEDTYLSSATPDAKDVAWKHVNPGHKGGFSMSLLNLPINPWWELDAEDRTVVWPYGWVKDSYEVVDNLFGKLFIYRERFKFVHKYKPR